MDNYAMDSHKLWYHTDRVSQWVRTGDVYPIYVEIGLSGACNHRCKFCAFDYIGYKPYFQEFATILAAISDMKECGVKSILFSGEGEPLLHKQAADIIRHTKSVGIDVALSTNGVYCDKRFARSCLSSISWVRVSLDAATPTTHAYLHGTEESDFPIILTNLDDMVSIKKEHGLECSIGVQAILLPDNETEIVELGEILKEIGVDYFAVKPYSHGLLSTGGTFRDLRYDDAVLDSLGRSVVELSNHNFMAVFRRHTMQKLEEGYRGYDHCYGLPFWAHIDAHGDVWGCGCYVGCDEFLYGNINEATFQDIWNSDKRKLCVDYAANELDTSCCRLNCRMDEINKYLWQLRHPPKHVNFI